MIAKNKKKLQPKRGQALHLHPILQWIRIVRKNTEHPIQGKIATNISL